MSKEIVRRMEYQLQVENTLDNKAEEKGWFRKRLMFQRFSSKDLLDFSELTEKDLKSYLRVHINSQTVSYLAEMINDNGSINLQFVKEQANIFKTQVHREKRFN